MNPFDLPGPQFLACYAAFGFGLWWTLRGFQYRREARLEIPRLNLTDPYEIAVLRGDENEAMRVAAISLVDRGLLKVNGDYLKAKDAGAIQHVRRPIEKAMLEHFSKSKLATSIYPSLPLKVSCDGYRKSLQAKNLVLKAEDFSHRMPTFIASLALAIGVSWVKIDLAVSRGRPFGILVIFTIILCICLTGVFRRRRTALGDRVMDDLRTLFQQLKTRAHLLRKGGDTNEVALLVAIYGITALSSEHDYAKLLFPKAATNDGGGSSSSSCSTSCGSTSSSCSGGGGGCGGCGGGGD